MAFFALANWPLWFLSVAMIVAAVIDGWKLKVPNWLTFPLILSGGVIAAAMITIRGQFRRNAQNTREIVGDLFSAPNIGTVAGKAAERKPRLQLLPYGIPLCIGFVGYLFFLYGA